MLQHIIHLCQVIFFVGYNIFMPNTFNVNLAIFRKKRGLSQRELAKKINTTHRMIAYYENETNSIPLDKLKLLAEILHVTPGELVTPLSNENKKMENIDVRLVKKLQGIEKLPDRDKRAINNHINALIEKNKLSKKD